MYVSVNLNEVCVCAQQARLDIQIASYRLLRLNLSNNVDGLGRSRITVIIIEFEYSERFTRNDF